MINGIDVSHHNNINWNDIQTLNLMENLYFVFAKASEGISFTDGKFADNRQGAASVGLLFGAYHFFLPTEDPLKQAETFVKQIGTVAPGELPPVVDIEWAPRGSKGNERELWNEITAPERLEVIKSFLDETERHLGIKPLIYTAVPFWNEFITPNNKPSDYAFFIDYPLWIVNLKGPLAVPKPWATATFGQNSFGEKAPKNASAFEKLDHDFFNGKLRGLLAFSAKGKIYAKGAPVNAVVRDFQQALKTLGFYSKSLDGDFGKNTVQAVKDFQKSLKIAETGQIDETTWKLLV